MSALIAIPILPYPNRLCCSGSVSSSISGTNTVPISLPTATSRRTLMNEYRCSLHGPSSARAAAVRRSAVPLVLGEAVARMLGLHLDHQPVTAHLRQHTCRRDARRGRVPADHWQRGHRQTGHPESIRQHVPRPHRQSGHGTSHALDVRHVYATAIYLHRRDEDHVVGQRVSAYQRKQPLALPSR